MNEALLHYLWRYRLVNPTDMHTTCGKSIVIIHPGTINHNSGPDFLEAKIKIDNTIWVGNVELHVKSSDWEKHGHANDEAYKNIILHIVYKQDKNILLNCPELELSSYLSQEIIDRYENLVTQKYDIACASHIQSFPGIIWEAWLERMLAERWEHKSLEWQSIWKDITQDWRSLLYYRLAANFGFHINRDAFLALAQSLPLTFLSLHRTHLLQLEALLFGQSGLLPVIAKDNYSERLEHEYHFLRRKYQLEPIASSLWKFMRLRPANFPTIRIAQFAAIIYNSESLFSKIISVTNTKSIHELLHVKASSYWSQHYLFGEESKEKKIKYLGSDAINNIIINTVAPIQYLYAIQNGNDRLRDNSIELLRQVLAENNAIINKWKVIGKIPHDAAQSQSMIQLYNHYCIHRKCLQCAVGNYILNKV